MSDLETTVLRADRWFDVDAGEVRADGVLTVEGNRIVGVDAADAPEDARTIDLGDVTLLPGLMDMELNSSSAVPRRPPVCPCPCMVCRTTRRTARCAG